MFIQKTSVSKHGGGFSSFDSYFSFAKCILVVMRGGFVKTSLPVFLVARSRTIYWAILMILYRVCCIEYTWLFVNAQFYAVLCISHSKCIFFLGI